MRGDAGEAGAADIVRFGVSMSARLLERFDALVAEKGYVNRSEALRDLVRASLVDERWEAGDAEAVGAVTLVCDHHGRDMADKLHSRHNDEIVSMLDVHLDADHCLRVVALRGVARDIRRIGDELIGTGGVKRGNFLAATAVDIA